jgi:hypothetical protein
MRYIRISSLGLIDPKAFMLIGASSKRDDKTKIGFFGSGLKYSLAYLLRNNIEMRVFSDYNEIKFSKEKTSFREKDFDVIAVNGEKTNMTTDMGIDWEAWFIIREIYCNALDETEANIRVINTDKTPVEPMPGSTVFYIAADQFEEIVQHWGDYFSEGREEVIHIQNGLNYLQGGEQLIVYRKGIRCRYAKQKCVFNYDADWIEINESRVIKDDFDFKFDLTKKIAECHEPKIIQQYLAMINESWEKELYWEHKSSSFSEVWLECIGKRTLVPYENAGFWADTISEDPTYYLVLPSKLCSSLKTRFVEKVRIIGEEIAGSGEANYKLVKRTDRMNNMIIASMEFLKKADYEVTFPIEVVKFIDPLQLGQADKEKILIGEKAFEKGMKQLISTIMEENEHLVSGHGDETRAFQTHIFERWITSLENHNKQYL